MKHLTPDDIGVLYMTSGVSSQFSADMNFALFVNNSLNRYLSSDWGDLPHADSQMNDAALKSGADRIFAKYIYPASPDLSIYIITEHDRSATTILFIDEY